MEDATTFESLQDVILHQSYSVRYLSPGNREVPFVSWLTDKLIEISACCSTVLEKPATCSSCPSSCLPLPTVMAYTHDGPNPRIGPRTAHHVTRRHRFMAASARPQTRGRIMPSVFSAGDFGGGTARIWREKSRWVWQQSLFFYFSAGSITSSYILVSFSWRVGLSLFFSSAHDVDVGPRGIPFSIVSWAISSTVVQQCPDLLLSQEAALTWRTSSSATNRWQYFG